MACYHSVLQELKNKISLNDYLLKIASSDENHHFLGKATQGCYLRLINLLTSYYKMQGRFPNEIKVLDWGTGKGQISYLLKKSGFNVTSCDIESDSGDSTFGQITPIITENNIDVVPLTHSYLLPFPDNSFDLVVSFGVLEHTQNDLASLNEIQRVLVSGGVFFFCFLPYNFSWIQRYAQIRGNYYHDRLYTKTKVKELARASGFDVGQIWHGQLFPKNSMPHNNFIEKLDRILTSYTPLKYIATNLEGFLIAK